MIHILHLEDDPLDAELVQIRLAEAGLACRITRVQSQAEYEENLRQDTIDIILADYQLPMYDGMSALRLAHEGRPDLPFIFVSGALGEETAIEALTQGATDYVLKQNLTRLAAAVQRALEEAEHRRHHQQVEQQVALLSFALNDIHEAAFIIDETARIRYVNQEACRLMGRSRAELLTMTLPAIHSEFSMQDWPDHWRDLKARAVLTFERDLETKAGHLVPVEINAHFFEYGGQGYFLELLRDITERKKAEADLQRLNQELEERVVQRTQALEASHTALETAYRDLKTAHAQMLQQEKMAAIGQLAAGVAHEINNPLSFVIANLGALQEYSGELVQFHQALETSLGGMAPGSSAADALAAFTRLRERDEIDVILEDIGAVVTESLEGGNRMKEIVENLKNFARLDEAAYTLADLNQGLETTLDIVGNELKDKASVTKSYGDIPQTMCNPSQLNQVFLNLLLNAVQAIEARGEIEVTSRATGDDILIDIADTGCGIPADHRDRIFEPFFTTKAVGQGTGLGLSIAYDIVAKHDGEIRVENRRGKGSRFTIRLPIRRD